MNMGVSIDDPRLDRACCSGLSPVSVVHENPWFRVCDRAGYFTVEYLHAQVTVVPVVANSAVVMVRARRPVIADEVLELPAGGGVAGEEPRETAARELAEETGISISDLGRFQALPPICVTPRSPVLPHLFRIDITTEEFEARGPHDGEVVAVECYSFEELRRKIVRSEIYTSLPLAVLARILLDVSATAPPSRGGGAPAASGQDSLQERFTACGGGC